MQSHKRLGALASAAAARLVLAVCRAGDGGSSSIGPLAAPYVLAFVISFPGTVPPGFVSSGFNADSFVEGLENSDDAPITNASVSINGAALICSVTNQGAPLNANVRPLLIKGDKQ